MTDIVQELREAQAINSCRMRLAAADEIDRLRAEVKALTHDIAQYVERDTERLAEVEALRAALRVAEAEMTCRNGNSHYCPNCDRSLYRALHDVRAALAAPKEEA